MDWQNGGERDLCWSSSIDLRGIDGHETAAQIGRKAQRLPLFCRDCQSTKIARDEVIIALFAAIGYGIRTTA